MRSPFANVLCAAWLMALFALPFTAPFPTCDLPGFFEGTMGHHGTAPDVPPVRSRSTVLEDGTYSILPTLNTESGRLKLAVVSFDSALNQLHVVALRIGRIQTTRHALGWVQVAQVRPSAERQQTSLRL